MSTAQAIGLAGGILGTLIGLFGATLGIVGGLIGAYIGIKNARAQMNSENPKRVA